MSTISDAVGIDRISRTSGFIIKKGNFSNESGNLPQVIAIFGEANTANQVGLTTDKVEVTSASEAASLFGSGSLIHRMVSILRPLSGDIVGGIPTVVYPQITSQDATATVKTITITGTANATAKHNLIISGRTFLDYQEYSLDVAVGDTATGIASKVKDAINKVTSAPCTASSVGAVVTVTSKWKGATSAQLSVGFDYGNDAAGITYAETASVNGGGSVDISDALAQFGDDWNTIVINPYGESVLSILEQFNGFPNPSGPTGRYSGLVFKPFVSYFGNTSGDKDVLASITDNQSRVNQVTNVLCVAPNSKGFNCEAAANVVALSAIVFQNTPHLDISSLSYPDMPIPADGNIGDMKDYNNRDFLVKKGCSTVTLVAGAYQVQDSVTTYHPEGEFPLKYAYPRVLNIIFNVKDYYKTMESIYLMDKTLVEDDQIVNVDNAIKPVEWKGIVYDMFDNLASDAMIKSPDFSKKSLKVKVSTINNNRFETTFDFKTTGTVRISSTTATAGF